jgi:hypothetical protein
VAYFLTELSSPTHRTALHTLPPQAKLGHRVGQISLSVTVLYSIPKRELLQTCRNKHHLLLVRPPPPSSRAVRYCINLFLFAMRNGGVSDRDVRGGGAHSIVYHRSTVALARRPAACLHASPAKPYRSVISGSICPMIPIGARY